MALDETAQAVGTVVTTIYAGVHQFYDSVTFATIIRKATDLDYPATDLHLAM